MIQSVMDVYWRYGQHYSKPAKTYLDCNAVGQQSALFYNIGRHNRFNLLTPTVAILTAIKHPVPDRVKPSFVIFDIQAL